MDRLNKGAEQRADVTGIEKSSCGVGFIASRHGRASHEHLRRALAALRCVEHRGACANDAITGDGSGVMADIPFELIGHARGTVAVATLFLTQDTERRSRALQVFEQCFDFMDVPVLEYRKVPVRVDDVAEVAAIVAARRALGATAALLVSNPLPPDRQVDPDLHDRLVADAEAAAVAAGVRGKDVTPLLLGWFHERSEGESLRANTEILVGNAALAAEIAVAVAT